jgi:FG-GAP repeat
MKRSIILVAMAAVVFCEGAARSALAHANNFIPPPGIQKHSFCPPGRNFFVDLDPTSGILAYNGSDYETGSPRRAFAVEPGKTQYLASADAVPEGLTTSDWTSIRAAYEAHQHQAVRVEGGYRTRNPEQQWRTEFDGHGFTTRPEAGDWQWGLELRSYGFPGQKRVIGNRAEVTAQGERVTYLWDTALREWFVNDQRGLEHGFTVAQRPAGANGEETRLEFDLAVRGSLRPEISADGETLRFEDPQGTTVLTYSGLKVSDADGSSLPARFVAEKGVRLLVDERGARYPITVDPIAQQAYLKASNTDANDLFGNSVAVSGDTVVVGAIYESSDATGVNGDQNNDNALNSGAAYVFVRNGTTWSQQAYLKASNTDANDLFGFSVAISGDTVVVGAGSEASNATGVNGNQDDNSATDAGAAYVFVRNGTTWSQQAYLKASNSDAGDFFGSPVVVSGDTVVVGAGSEDSNATGVNGNQTDNSATDAGAAYVFVRNGATWSQQAYLKASNTDAGDAFGAVAVSGDTVVVGADLESSNATGINGDQTDNSATEAGAAYVFVRNGATWSQQAYLKASNTDAGDFFGVRVAVSGDTVVVGAVFEDGNTTGINGDQTDNSATDAGAAYVFVRNGATWSQQAYLKASNTDAGDAFGFSVAISGDAMVVGASFEASNATGVNGNQADNSAGQAGAAYVFVRDGTTWSQQAYLKASNTDAGDFFGDSVAVSGDTVVVGAAHESSSATGVNGDQTNNSAASAGAAYIFTGLGGIAPIIPLLNISTRLNVGTGENVLIGGFIVVGTDPKRVILRAIGPSLADLGVPDALADPILELHKPGNIIVTNDNWRDTQEQEIIDTTIPPTNDLESSIVATLDPGAYTAIVRGKDNGTGIGLVEVYDLDQAADSQLANISTRGFVDMGDNVMIGGFIVGGGSSTTVLVRAIGPSLAGIGVANPLQDPTLELHDSSGATIALDDNWRDTQEQEIIDTTIPPTNDFESAIVADLAPGAYTAIVRGKDNTTGVGLMEVYNLQ